jgi:hypothetical protein
MVATEGALWGSVKAHGFLPDTVIVSDDAGQFNVGQHGLCWVHSERLVHKLDAFTDENRAAQATVRELICLRAKFKKDPNGRWHWIEMRPGNRPMRELAKQLACVAGETGDLMEAWADRFEQVLAKSSFGIGEVLSDIPVVQASESSRILLLVPQMASAL